MPSPGCELRSGPALPRVRRRNAWRGLSQLVLAWLTLVVGLRTAPAQPTGLSDDSCVASAGAEGRDASPESDCDLWTRSTLTGDWWGRRTDWQASGVTLSGKTTQFAFGVAGGIDQSPPEPLGRGDRFAYTGRNEYDLGLDLEPVVGIRGGSLLVRLEQWYGEFGNVSLSTGTFAAAVAAAELPPAKDDPGRLFLTNLLWTQTLTERLTVFAGRRSGLQPADRGTFGGGDGTDQFVNMALFDNPALLLGVPYTSFAVGFSSPQEWGELSGFVCDPADRTLDLCPIDDLFSEGVVVCGQATWKTEVRSRPGRYHVGAVWKHVSLTDLRFAEPPPGVYPEPKVPGFPTLDDSYTLYCGCDQYLVRYSDDGRGWGLFARASISDGNPTPVWYFLSAGVGGDSPWGAARGDRFGIGWYFVGASREFGPQPQATYGPRDGTGLEIYYNLQLTPWLNVTPDVQLLRAEASAIADHAVICGIRVGARF